MSEDIRRIEQDLQRQQREIEWSAGLLKNTQAKLFSGTDGTVKTPNKRFAYHTPDEQHPFKVYARRKNGVAQYKVIKTSYMYGYSQIEGLDEWKNFTADDPCSIFVEADVENHVITSLLIKDDEPNKGLYEPAEGGAPQTKSRLPIAYVYDFEDRNKKIRVVQNIKTSIYPDSHCIDGFAYLIFHGFIN
jgi:hypothetical protein